MIGVVREVRDDGVVVLESGAVRVVLRPEGVAAVLEPIAAPAGRPQASANPPIRPSADVASEIKLLGLRAEEAEAELTRALDAAILSDLPYLRIIHGKGTGALREMVQRILERDPRVARFGFAPANQGGAGVTVAEFRA
jgi:DNA mismatch repair protein MutS2